MDKTLLRGIHESAFRMCPQGVQNDVARLPRHSTKTNTTKVRGSLPKAPPVKFFSPQALDKQAVLRRPLGHPGPKRIRRRVQSEQSSGSKAPPSQILFSSLGRTAEPRSLRQSEANSPRIHGTEDARLLSRLRTSCTQLLARLPRTLTSVGKNGPRLNGPSTTSRPCPPSVPP